MWNHDFTHAPRDGKHVILALANGQTIRSYWCKPKNDPEHWCMLSHKNEPLAWCAWPEHPNHQSDAGAFAAVKGSARLANAPSVEPSASGHFIIDDCGSGQ